MKTTILIALFLIPHLLGILLVGCNTDNSVNEQPADDIDIASENSICVYYDSQVLSEQLTTDKEFSYPEYVEKETIILDINETYNFQREDKRINFIHIESDKYLMFRSGVPRLVMTGKIFIMVDTYFLDFELTNTDNDVATIELLITLSNE